jgi:hypothetical protein
VPASFRIHALDPVIRLGRRASRSRRNRRRRDRHRDGRSRRAEDIFLPLVSIGAPIPGLAYAPLFLLWFGLGNKSTVLLVAFVSAFPIIFNTWTGVKAVKEIWVRSAQAMGATTRACSATSSARRAALHPHRPAASACARPGAFLVGVEMLAACRGGSAG